MSLPASTNTTIPPFAALILEEYFDQIRPTLILYTESLLFIGILTPLLLSLVYFSTPNGRQSFMWRLVLFVLILVIVTFVMGAYLESVTLFRIPNIDGNFIRIAMAFSFLTTFGVWFVDWVVFARLLVVYPYKNTPKLKFIALISFPLAIKVARAGVLLTLCKPWTTSCLTVQSNKLARVEWILAMFDNSYASFFFLRKLRGGFRSSDQGRISAGNRNSIGARMRALFWIAATNFVFPCVYNLAQIIVALTTPGHTAIQLQLPLILVSIVGVAFATVWNNTHAVKQQHSVHSSSNVHGGLGPGAQLRVPGRSATAQPGVQMFRQDVPSHTMSGASSSLADPEMNTFELAQLKTHDGETHGMTPAGNGPLAIRIETTSEEMHDM